MVISIKDIIAADAPLKGDGFASDASRLLALYEGRGREVVREYLRAHGIGDQRQRDPIMFGTVQRLVDALSVLYSGPALRILTISGLVLPADHAGARAFEEVSDSIGLDLVWAEIDKLRRLLRTVVVQWAETDDGITARVFPPHLVYRHVSPSAADDLSKDEAIALQLSDHATDPRRRVYQVWRRMPLADGGSEWRVTVEDETGQASGAQPYAESDGVIPFDMLPLQLITDAKLMGRAYHPIPQHRLTSSLAVDGAINDVSYLMQLEAHTEKLYSTDDVQGLTDALAKTGPDRKLVANTGTTAQLLAHSPQIDKALMVVEKLLSKLAAAESLPPDTFADVRSATNAEAVRVIERDLDRRRRALAPLAASQERQAYKILASILEVYGPSIGLPKLDREAQLSVTFSNAWQPSSPGIALQNAMREVGIGAKSMPELVAESRGCSLHEARQILRQVQIDGAEFPAPSDILLGADGAGPRLATGTDSMRAGSETQLPQLNPGVANLANSVDGSSIVEAVRSKLAS